jgi:phospholipid N-methyltransferase
MTVEEVKARARIVYPGVLALSERWLNHINNRLAYEKAMLEDQGASHLITPKARPKQLPPLNYRAPRIMAASPFYSERGQTFELTQIEITSAEYKRIHDDYKGTRIVDNAHRVRIVCAHVVGGARSGPDRFVAVFLTDTKAHPKPKPVEKPEPVEATFSDEINEPKPPIRDQFTSPRPKPEINPFEAMKDSLKAGIKVVSAPQLFPTPKELAEKMANLLDVQPGHRILEPSAGTGILLGVIGGRMFKGTNEDTTPYKERDQLYAVEINHSLAQKLGSEFPLTKIICGDFLEQYGNLGKFDRVIMNPPFINGADIQHIKHARTFLKPGGKLVALCANGPRQKRELEPLADYWEPLPEGSFSNQGTNVNVVLLTIEEPEIAIPQYVVKCDDCKATLRLSHSMQESVAGGRCASCTAPVQQPTTAPGMLF